MLLPYSATEGYATALDVLTESAVSDVDRLLASVAGESPLTQKTALMDVLPTVGDDYAIAFSEVTAQFFTELQDIQEISKPVAPEVLENGLGANAWRSLVGYSTNGTIAEQTVNNTLLLMRLAGGMTKRLTETAADTMVGNAAIQGGMLAQRVPRPGCCAFCGMLASRGAKYASDNAESVVGRGVPVAATKGKAGGQGKGIRPRGARKIGETFHDYCRCRVVAVSSNNAVELQATADKYYEAYASSADKFGYDSSSKERTSKILAHMREELNIR